MGPDGPDGFTTDEAPGPHPALIRGYTALVTMISDPHLCTAALALTGKAVRPLEMETETQAQCLETLSSRRGQSIMPEKGLRLAHPWGYLWPCCLRSSMCHSQAEDAECSDDRQ